jgi:hypothetical protein
MSDNEYKDIIKKIEAYGDKVSSSKEKAIESLRKAGICDKDGKLSPPYK